MECRADIDNRLKTMPLREFSDLVARLLHHDPSDDGYLAQEGEAYRQKWLPIVLEQIDRSELWADEVCRRLGLPTDTQRRVEREERTVHAAEEIATAARESAIAAKESAGRAWVSVWIAAISSAAAVVSALVAWRQAQP